MSCKSRVIFVYPSLVLSRASYFQSLYFHLVNKNEKEIEDKLVTFLLLDGWKIEGK